ncbi:MAG: hypothetical protein IMW86_05960 [Hydrogenibacillus sp.]|nr:hypothetical protein [Hydrogenibacillus sp.]
MERNAHPGLGYWLLHLFVGREESRDDAVFPAIRTRYFRERGERVMETVETVIRADFPSLRLEHVDVGRGEMVAVRRTLLATYDVMITVYRLSPTASAVDIVSTRRGMFGDLGAGYRLIRALYEKLDGRLKPMVGRDVGRRG